MAVIGAAGVAWALAATVLRTTLLAASQGLGWTRLSAPLLLGSAVTADRDRARAVGTALHLATGLALALLYEVALGAVRLAPVGAGAALGLLHGAFLVAAALPALPGVHPRMARAHAGPAGARVLEPPGALGLRYGRWTPLVVVAAHVAFGAFLGLGAALR